MIDKALPGSGQRDAASIALEKVDAEGLFHTANAGTRRRKGQIRALRPVRDASSIGNVEKKPKIDQIEPHESNISY